MMDRLYCTAVVGSVALLLTSCGGSQTPQPATAGKPDAGKQDAGKQDAGVRGRVTLYVADMAERLEIL